MRRYEPKKIEEEILKFWEGKKIPERIVKFDGKRPKYYLLDGPPYVNYVPHAGHVKTTTFKDIWGKFKYMQGHSVWFQPGFDCSGLPIENAVEKELGVKSKKDIERIGVEKFMAACKQWAEKNKSVWMDMYRDLAAWRGWVDPYLTYKNYYLESGWWTIKKIHEKGMFVEGHKPGFWCPKCETVLAGYEVTDSYKNVEDPSIYIKFRVRGVENEYLLVWTTTPWTLPANVAVVAHPDETYVKVRTGEDVLILAEKRLGIFQDLEMGYTVLEKFPGKKLDGLEYEPILDVPSQRELEKNKKAHRVYLSIPIMLQRVASKVKTKGAKAEEQFGHMVDMETGTGLVHTAPGHGDVDNKLGKHYGLPEPSPVDESGKLTKDAGEFAGIFVKDADPKIIDKLRSTGMLLYSTTITHSYPLCWRCKAPLIYRMSHQWFLKVNQVRTAMLEENENVNWLPEFARERFQNILIGAPDWAITRQRYWGIPLPIWICKKCGTKEVIGSRKELVEKATVKVNENIDLHKDSVDKIKIRCTGCGGEAERVPDIMDVWFDSGISPWASLGYPFKNKELFEKLWPVDLIDESQDQVRGWFYTLMFCGVAAFGKRPYNTVCLNGWTLDGKGEKMSKSLGNVVWADDAIKELGADLLRLYYCWNVAPWDTQKFNMGVAKDLGRALNVLWNTYLFIKTYGNMNAAEPKEFNAEDKWIISKINSLIQNTTKNMEEFRFHYAGRDIVDFLMNDFSRWYIKIIRSRVSPWYTGADKEAAQYTMNYVLGRLIRLFAPMTPYISEKVYTDLFSKSSTQTKSESGSSDSVHLSEWPKYEKERLNKPLEEEMDFVKSLMEAMGFARQEAKIRLKWPLAEIRVQPKDDIGTRALTDLKGIIMTMGNVKDVKPSDELPGGREFEFGRFELGDVVEDEAFLREVIREVQKLRKKAGLNVQDKIRLTLETDKKSEDVLKKQEKELLLGVGGESVTFGKAAGAKGELDFEQRKVIISF